MRILWLSPYLPVPYFGGGTRVFNLVRTLASTSEVDLIAGAETWPGPPQAMQAVDDLRARCRSVEVIADDRVPRNRRRLLQLRSLVSRRSSQYWTSYSPRLQEHIDLACRRADYDVVVLEHSFMGFYSLPPGRPKVLDQHNVESEVFLRAGRRERSAMRRAYNMLESARYRREEQHICGDVDLILATSQHDCALMERWTGLPPCLVIPNGVDTTYFAPPENRQKDEQPNSVVFTGTMRYSPNVGAMLSFTSDVWPLIRQRVPDATLTIVGGAPAPEIQQLDSLAGVRVTGYVPEVRPYLGSAWGIVAPLRIGGGTRLKILEALSMSCAVVSTSLGCEGLEVQDGRDLVIADEPKQFAARVIELLHEPSQRATLGRAGRALTETFYDWHALGLRMEAALRGLTRPVGGTQDGSDSGWRTDRSGSTR